MGAETGIKWTDSTFKPWWGCLKVSPGCDNCYAETFDKRVHGADKAHWGKGAPRREFGEKHWNEPLRWNAAAQKAGKPSMVFCASMADWCDAEAPAGAVERLHAFWRATPWLRWQMLTKRPARIRMNLPSDWGDGYPHVWLGVTVEDRTHGWPRVDVLRSIPAKVRFLSCEPLLEDVSGVNLSGIHWAICGGESGHHARPFTTDWARNLLAACRASGARYFFKQLGDKPTGGGAPTKVAPMGKDPEQWPTELRVHEFPDAP
jgi:protein gp37